MSAKKTRRDVEPAAVEYVAGWHTERVGINVHRGHSALGDLCRTATSVPEHIKHRGIVSNPSV